MSNFQPEAELCRQTVGKKRRLAFLAVGHETKT